MKTIILLILLLAPLVSLKANYVNPYMTGQSVGRYPLIGMGARGHWKHHGFDVSAQTAPTLRGGHHARGSYLYYPTERGFHLRGGVGYLGGPLIGQQHGTGTWEMGVGYEWQTTKKQSLFVSLDAIVPFKSQQGIPRVYPGLSIGFTF